MVTKAVQQLFARRVKERTGFTPTPEFRFHPLRRWRFDFAIPELLIAVEVEGGVWTYGRHNRAEGFLRDMEKYNSAAAFGWRILRCQPDGLLAEEFINLVGRTCEFLNSPDFAPPFALRPARSAVEVAEAYGIRMLPPDTPPAPAKPESPCPTAERIAKRRGESPQRANAILLAIRPRYAEAILSGRKRYEYRRAIPGRRDITRVLLYASAPVCRIVGECTIGRVVVGPMQSVWDRTSTRGGITLDEFQRYFREAPIARALRVENPIAYPEPIDPRAAIPGFRPPQNFCYIYAAPEWARAEEPLSDNQ